MLACVYFVFKMYTKIPGIYVEQVFVYVQRYSLSEKNELYYIVSKTPLGGSWSYIGGIYVRQQEMSVDTGNQCRHKKRSGSVTTSWIPLTSDVQAGK